MKSHNEKLMAECGISKAKEQPHEGVTYWHVSGGKTMTTLNDEKITYRDIVNRASAARFEEGQDDIRGELRRLLKCAGE